MVNLLSSAPVASNLTALPLTSPQPNEPLFHYSSMPSASRVNLFMPSNVPSYDLPQQPQQRTSILDLFLCFFFSKKKLICPIDVERPLVLFQVDEKSPTLDPLFDLGDPTFESFDPLPASTTLQVSLSTSYNFIYIINLPLSLFSRFLS
jgi:hypothetical protein